MSLLGMKRLRLLWVYCCECYHERDVNPATVPLPPQTPVPEVGKHMKCSACGKSTRDRSCTLAVSWRCANAYGISQSPEPRLETDRRSPKNSHGGHWRCAACSAKKMTMALSEKERQLFNKPAAEAKAARLFGSQTCCFGKERAPTRAAGAEGRLFRSRYRGGPRRKVYVANQPEAVQGRLLARQIFSAPRYTGKVAHTSLGDTSEPIASECELYFSRDLKLGGCLLAEPRLASWKDQQ